LAQERTLALTGWLWLPQELWLLAGVLCLSVLAVAWPLRQAYRLDVMQSLNKV
jgi:putative ABC transport system permease protein